MLGTVIYIKNDDVSSLFAIVYDLTTNHWHDSYYSYMIHDYTRKYYRSNKIEWKNDGKQS